MDASRLIGKYLRDENNRGIGRITSFLIDSSGRVEEVLVEESHGKIIKYPVERLKTDQDKVSLISQVEGEIRLLAEKFPLISRKRGVLDKLSENKVIPEQILQNLCKEFDKALKEMQSTAKNLLEDIDKQVKDQEDYIRMLELARAFLEIEYAMGTVEDEIYKQSITSLLREVKNASQRKLVLLDTKEKVSSVIQSKEEEPSQKPLEESTEEPETEADIEPGPTPVEAEPTLKTESTEEERAITVHMTRE